MSNTVDWKALWATVIPYGLSAASLGLGMAGYLQRDFAFALAFGIYVASQIAAQAVALKSATDGSLDKKYLQWSLGLSVVVELFVLATLAVLAQRASRGGGKLFGKGA